MEKNPTKAAEKQGSTLLCTILQMMYSDLTNMLYLKFSKSLSFKSHIICMKRN